MPLASVDLLWLLGVLAFLAVLRYLLLCSCERRFNESIQVTSGQVSQRFYCWPVVYLGYCQPWVLTPLAYRDFASSTVFRSLPRSRSEDFSSVVPVSESFYLWLVR